MSVPKSSPQLYARVPPRLRALVRDMWAYIAITGVFLVLATLFPIQGVTQTLVLAWLLALVLYEPLFVARAGGTIGHRSLNLRVVAASDLGPVSFPHAIARTIVKAVVGIPVFVAVYFTAKHQGLHDLVAGTVVVPRDSSVIRNEWFTAERWELTGAASTLRQGRVAVWLHVLLSPWWLFWWAIAAEVIARGASPPERTQVHRWAVLVVLGVGASVWVNLLIGLVRWRREGREVTWRYPVYWALGTILSVAFAIVLLFPWSKRTLAPLEVGAAYAPVQET